ncbi:MAG TPA: pirin-like C-terminal cupin domain-containing protein [Gemmatimonadaceae bacterium]|nr:pirin-like C-terminal cupin domain-containing protein [Gemmatimonadaceae bacterium]
MTTSAKGERSIARIVTTAPPAPGFAGPGHTAVMVVDPAEFSGQDPFIVLMDDRVDMPEGVPIGGEHPHAGFEIATFLLEGAIHDQDEGVLEAGDVQWMLAGRGVIHNEHSMPRGRTRILQLWFTIPATERWSEPRIHTTTRDSALVRREPGVEARVYGEGSTSDSRRGRVPVLIVDVAMEPGARFEQALPASFNGFVYVLEGAVRVAGEDGAVLRAGQVGWLDRPSASDASVLRLRGEGANRARVVLYAGEPQNRPLVTHGPFVGETRADLMRVSRDYVDGKFDRVSALMQRGAGRNRTDE